MHTKVSSLPISYYFVKWFLHQQTKRVIDCRDQQLQDKQDVKSKNGQKERNRKEQLLFPIQKMYGIWNIRHNIDEIGLIHNQA